MMSDKREQVIALHGFTGQGHDWDLFSKTLAQEFTFVAPDIIGHGKAQKPNDVDAYAMETVASDIISLVDEPFHLLGYSMGGRLALYIATHYPEHVKSLVLESASPGLKTEAERESRRKADNALADKIEQNGIVWFVKYWEQLPLWDSQTPELKAQLRDNRLKNNPIGLANSLRGMGTGVMPSLWDKLSTLPMPVKLIVGEIDAKFVAINQEMARLIPNAELSIVENAGHTVHLEKPQIFATIVSEFLAKQLSA